MPNSFLGVGHFFILNLSDAAQVDKDTAQKVAFR